MRSLASCMRQRLTALPRHGRGRNLGQRGLAVGPWTEDGISGQWRGQSSAAFSAAVVSHGQHQRQAFEARASSSAVWGPRRKMMPVGSSRLLSSEAGGEGGKATEAAGSAAQQEAGSSAKAVGSEEKAKENGQEQKGPPSPMQVASSTWDWTVAAGQEGLPNPAPAEGGFVISKHHPLLGQRPAGSEDRVVADQRQPTGLRAWLYKASAMWLIKTLLPKEPKFQNSSELEADIATGGSQCLRYLASSLDGTEPQPELVERGLTTDIVEHRLMNLIVDMVKTFSQGGVQWKWEVKEVEEARVERIFVVLGARRSVYRKPEKHVLSMFGQQLLLSKEQLEKFLGGLRTRMEVMQDIMNEAVIVADVSFKAKQVASKAEAAANGTEPAAGESSEADAKAQPQTSDEQPKSADGQAPSQSGDEKAPAGDAPDQPQPESVIHVLRLEIPLKLADPEDDMVYLKPGHWEIVDWNNVCHGNHPVLPVAPW